MSIINERIKERRQQVGLTLYEVADAIGVKEATVQRYESGAIKNISHDIIGKLSELFNCSPSYLMGWEESEPAATGIELSPIEEQIILKFRELTEGERNLILRALDISERS